MDGLALVLISSKDYDQAIDVIKKALKRLPNIQANPYYDNLLNKLNIHLQQAQIAQEGG
jgi:tetratricopeptide (TPR) repeat protein